MSKFLGMCAELDKEGVYTLDQEDAIGDRLNGNGLADAKATHNPPVMTAMRSKQTT